MRLVIQRVLHAEVQVDGNTIGKIGKGLLVFVGAGQNDTKEIADKYGVNMYEKYPVSDDECEGEWEEVE